VGQAIDSHHQTQGDHADDQGQQFQSLHGTLLLLDPEGYHGCTRSLANAVRRAGDPVSSPYSALLALAFILAVAYLLWKGGGRQVPLQLL